MHPIRVMRVIRGQFPAHPGAAGEQRYAIPGQPLMWESIPRLFRSTRARGVGRFLLLLQFQEFLRSRRSIRVVLMHGVFKLLVVFLHMLFVLLLVQLVLVLR